MKWVGIDDDPDEYPARNFKNSPKAIKSFHEQHPELPEPPVNLTYWLQCAEDDETAEDCTDDNRIAISKQRGKKSCRKASDSYEP